MRLRVRASFVAAFVLAGLSGGAASAQDTAVGFQSVEWSPDGRRLLVTVIERKPDYSDYDPEKWRLVVVDVDSGALRRIETGATTGCFSPDGKRVAYAKSWGGGAEVFVMDLATGDRVNVSRTPGRSSAPTWSPDGTRIAFVSGRDGAQELWTVSPDGSGARRLTHSEGAKPFNPVWSPDGKEIAYYLEKGDRKDQVWVVGADGAGAVNVTHDEEHNIYPGWGPKGTLLFSVGDKFVTMPRAGGAKTPIAGAAGFFARVSPDGTRIAWIDKVGPTVWVARLEGDHVEDAKKPFEPAALKGK
ncbi:MAG: LpqB family beta-propeller domain-containing protein [Thermoanaerobaculia bacterium]